MGILSPSEIFTKHGDKMIFKNPILSPSKLFDNGDLVSIPHKKHMIMGTLSPSKIFTKHRDKMIFKNPILSPIKNI